MTVLLYPGTKLFEEAKSNDLLISPDEDLGKYGNKKCDYLNSVECRGYILRKYKYLQKY